MLQWFGTNTDVTDFVVAEEALRDAHRRQAEFLAVLSHELLNPAESSHHRWRFVQDHRAVTTMTRPMMA